MSAALSERTRKEYRRDLCRFLDRGAALPASPEIVADCLAAHAGMRAVATLQRWRVSIGRAHTSQGLTDPTKSDLVKATLRGIRREHGAAQRQVAPTLRDELIAMVRPLTDGPRALRDRALLLIGFAGALRRSELVALRVDDLVLSGDGVKLTLRRSKTDQEQQGRDIGSAVRCVRSARCWTGWPCSATIRTVRSTCRARCCSPITRWRGYFDSLPSLRTFMRGHKIINTMWR